MIFFSIKNAFRKKVTAILAALGVGIGLMLVFVIGAFTAGVSAQFDSALSRTLGIVTVSKKFGAGPDLPLDFPDDLFNTSGVGEFIINYNVECQAKDYFTDDYTGEMDNAEDKLVLIGINKTLDERWGGATSKIISGRNFILGENETIIDSRLLNVAKFSTSIGSNITIQLDLGGIKKMNLTIVGVYKQEDDGAPSFVPRNYFIYTDIQVIWDLFDIAGEVSNIYTTIFLRFNVDSHDDTNQYASLINENSENGLYDPIYVQAFSLSAIFQEIEETFAVFDSFTLILSIIVVLAGGMGIIVTQLMSVTGRMKEFAILKATGWKNLHIFKDVIYESLTLGILGAGIGLILGSILIVLLGTGINPFGSVQAIITIEGIIEVLAYALGLGVLGGLYPGIKASRVRPVVVLKGE
jgi:putative ABC transport system permease protein